MERKDFSYTYNAEGYMIQYKGKNIGGAGITGKYQGRGRQRQQQIAEYKEQAEITIDMILSYGKLGRFKEAIEKIDAEGE
jgi:hypothetical protein